MNLNSNSVQRDQKKRLHARNIIFSLILGITFIFNSFASINVYSQTEITISVEDTSIIDVLDEIEANTKLRFIFDSSIYNFNQKVSISLEKKNIEETISALFNNLIDSNTKLSSYNFFYFRQYIFYKNLLMHASN